MLSMKDSQSLVSNLCLVKFHPRFLTAFGIPVHPFITSFNKYTLSLILDQSRKHKCEQHLTQEAQSLMGGTPIGIYNNNLVRYSLGFMAKNFGCYLIRDMVPVIRRAERRK